MVHVSVSCGPCQQEEIQQALDDTRGLELPGFINYAVFRVLVEKRLSEIEPHIFQLLDEYFRTMSTALARIAEHQLKKLPVLLDEIAVRNLCIISLTVSLAVLMKLPFVIITSLALLRRVISLDTLPAPSLEASDIDFTKLIRIIKSIVLTILTMII